MKCNLSHPGFELVSPCPFPTTITIIPRAPLMMASERSKTARDNFGKFIHQFLRSQKAEWSQCWQWPSRDQDLSRDMSLQFRLLFKVFEIAIYTCYCIKSMFCLFFLPPSVHLFFFGFFFFVCLFDL